MFWICKKFRLLAEYNQHGRDFTEQIQIIIWNFLNFTHEDKYTMKIIQ